MADKRDAQATKPPPPPRRQTMEVQMAWLEVRADEPKVEQIANANVATPAAGEVERKSGAPTSPPPMQVEKLVESNAVGTAENEFPDDEAPTALRRKPPRVPGALRTLPPMPLSAVPTKPPPPPRRQTQEVEMSWVELVDDDVVEDDDATQVEERKSGELPKLYDEHEPREITRVEDAPISTERIEKEKAAALAEAVDRFEGPPISDTMRQARAEEAQQTAKRPPLDDAKLAAEAIKKERLSQFLQAVSVSASTSIPPGAMKVSDATAAANEPSEADLDKMREEALAARRREQDARDREIREKRRAERERERIEQEAKAARREQEKREEEERAAALRQGTPDKQLLDLSGIDDEIDNALDAMLGPNLSYPPPPPSSDDEGKK